MSAAELPHVYALVNARVVTSPGKVDREGHRSSARRRRSTAWAPSGAVAVPADAEVMDLAGQTISPGLIDPLRHGLAPLGRAAGSSPTTSPAGRRGAGGPRRAAPTPAPGAGGNCARRSSQRAPREVGPHGSQGVARGPRTLRDLGFTVVAAVPDKGILRGESAVVRSRTAPSRADDPRREVRAARRARRRCARVRRGVSGRRRWASVAAVRQAFSDAKWLARRGRRYARSRRAGAPRSALRRRGSPRATPPSGKETVVFEAPDVLALLRAAKIAAEFG